MDLKPQIDLKRLPKHIAVIMDGNGRWAKKQGLIRAIGHETGTKAVREVVDASVELGVKYLTLYAFSTENWNRPKMEVDALMRLLVKSLKKELPRFIEGKVRLNVIGNIQALPSKAKKELEFVIKSPNNLKASTPHHQYPHFSYKNN